MFIVGVLIVALIVYMAIALHELGHMWPSRRFGVPVHRYAIGFGPTLFSFTRGETTYLFNLLPLGGYVQLDGMVPPPRGRRFWFMRVMQEGESDSPHAFWRLPAHKKIAIMFGGPAVNLGLAAIGYLLVFSLLGIPVVKPVIDQVTADYPAAAAGLQPGERITAIDDQPVRYAQEIRPLIQDRQQVQVRLERDGAARVVTLSPRDGLIGVRFTLSSEHQSGFAAMSHLLVDMGGVAKAVVALPYTLSQTVMEAAAGQERSSGMMGLIGVARVSGEITAQEDVDVLDKVRSMVWIFASINLALFVFNMLPLLPFDGGHIASALFESGRRRLYRLLGKADPGPVNVAYMLPLTLVIVAALVVMGVALAWVDLVSPLRIR